MRNKLPRIGECRRQGSWKIHCAACGGGYTQRTRRPPERCGMCGSTWIAVIDVQTFAREVGTGLIKIKWSGHVKTWRGACSTLYQIAKRAEMWLGKMIADEGHKNSVYPEHCVMTLRMLSTALTEIEKEMEEGK